jgi:hypothetical protein
MILRFRRPTVNGRVLFSFRRLATPLLLFTFIMFLPVCVTVIFTTKGVCPRTIIEADWDNYGVYGKN